MTTANQTKQSKQLTVLLWRHAPTPDNSSGRLQGRRDTDTSEEGLAIGRQAAKIMVERYGLPAAISSSPLRRATETAQLLSDLGGPPWESDDAMTQRSYGVWEGKTLEQVARDYPRELAVRDSGGDPNIPGWESGRVVGERVARAIIAGCHAAMTRVTTERLAQHSENSSHQDAKGSGPVVFVSHGSAIASGVRNLLGLPEQPQILGHLRHAHWVELRYKPEVTGNSVSQWTLQGFNLGPIR